MHLTIFFSLAMVGLLAGFIDSIAGGGGLLTIPALLSFGLSPHVALGTNKLASTVGVLNSVYIYFRKRLYKPRLWLLIILASASGSAIGAIAIHYISANWLNKIIPLILIIIAIYIAIPKNLHHKGQTITYRPPPYKGSLLGIILGFYDGFFGPGTGSFWTSALIFFFKLDLLQATAIAKLMNFISNAIATLIFICYSSINYGLAFALMLGYILGAYLGAHSAIRYGHRLIKPLFLTVVLAIVGKLIWQYW